MAIPLQTQKKYEVLNTPNPYYRAAFRPPPPRKRDPLKVPNTLEELDKIHKYDTDKIKNGFAPSFCFHFDPIRFDVRSIMEIGVWTGGSMRMWLDYFPNATVVGVDNILKRYVPISSERAYFELGNAVDSKFADYLIDKYDSFDIVIDDGSHKASEMRAAFYLYWPHTNYIYEIEDLGTQYKSFGQSRYMDVGSMVDDLKSIIDSNNDIHMKVPCCPSICFHSFQCFIYKRLVWEG
jgi:hypothetical protein